MGAADSGPRNVDERSSLRLFFTVTVTRERVCAQRRSAARSPPHPLHSWMVIPGAAFDETVKGVAGVRGTYATFEASAKDFVRELPALDAATLLTPQGARSHGAQLTKWLGSRLEFEGDGRALRANLSAIEAVPRRGDLRLSLRYAWNGGEPKTLDVRCLPFARDREHKTFLTLYRGTDLVRQDIFDANTPQLRVVLRAAPGATFTEPGA